MLVTSGSCEATTERRCSYQCTGENVRAFAECAWFAASQTGGAESDNRRAGRFRHWWSVAGLCQKAPESPRRWGAGAKENTTISRLVGLAAGRERCIAWRRGAQARPVFPTPNQRANSARRNPRTVTWQQRRGQPGRPLWRTRRQGSSYRLGAVAAGRDGYRRGRQGGRSGGRSDGQRRLRP